MGGAETRPNFYERGNAMKKFIYIFISILIIAAIVVVSPLFAFGSTKTDGGELSLLQEGDFEVEISEKYSDNGVISDYLNSAVERTIYNGLLNVSSEIDVRIYRIPQSECGALLSNVINDNPDLFYVSSTYRYRYSQGSSYINYIIPYYSMPKEEIEQAKEVFYSGVDKALSEVDSSMNDIQKALTLHDYICDISTYPDISTDNKEIYHSAYGVFYDGNAVCAGYTLAYSYLMHELGIESEYVSSSGMQHAWNKIKIDGNWYNIDITYDNFDLIEAENTVGSVRHYFFMKSDDFFAGANGLYHFGGVTYDTCEASSTEYDSHFWNDVNSRIYTLNGYYYYMNPDFKSNKAYLTKRSEQGSEVIIGSAYYSATYDAQSGAYDENGNLQTIEYSDILIRLAFLDRRFYITNQTDIYSQLLSGQRFKIAEMPYYSSGLSVRNDNIVYNLYADKTLYELDKLEFFENNITTSKGEYNNYPDIDMNGVVNAKDYAQIIS